MNIVSWTGGSKPHKYATIGAAERAIVQHQWRKQALTFFYHWGNCPLDVCRTFWKRARYDAHATIRQAIETGAERISA
jgi:hypothetical protein